MRTYLVLFLVSLYSISQAESDWKVVVTNSDYVLRCVDFVDHKTAVAVGDGGLILKSTDGGKTWKEKSKGTFGDINLVAVYDKDVLAACGTGFILHSTDAGESWKQVWTGNSEKFRYLKFMTNELAEMPNRVVAAGDNGILMISNSNGAKWFKQDVSKISGDANILYCITNYTDLIDDTIAYVLTSKGTQFATRNGFQSKYGAPDQYFDEGEVDVIHTYWEFELGFVRDHGAAYGKKSGGKGTFLHMGGGLGHQDLSRGLVRLTGGFFHGFAGDHKLSVYRVAVGEGGYITEGTGREQERIWEDRKGITDKNLYWCDRGIDMTEPKADRISVIAVGDGVILRREFGEHPNDPVNIVELPAQMAFSLFPNPFMSDANVSYHLANEASVQLMVYGMNGQLISERRWVEQAAGRYTLPLTGIDEKGVYFVRLQVGEMVSTKKLIRQ